MGASRHASLQPNFPLSCCSERANSVSKEDSTFPFKTEIEKKGWEKKNSKERKGWR